MRRFAIVSGDIPPSTPAECFAGTTKLGWLRLARLSRDEAYDPYPHLWHEDTMNADLTVMPNVYPDACKAIKSRSGHEVPLRFAGYLALENDCGLEVPVIGLHFRSGRLLGLVGVIGAVRDELPPELHRYIAGFDAALGY